VSDSSRGRRTLGVVGTLVWDRIVPWRAGSADVEDWGGIAYALVAAGAVLPEGWAVRPVIRIGSDLEGPARDFLGQLRSVDPSGLAVVPEANNRVELRYQSEADRTETLTGGVSGWPLPDLLQAVAGCDALLVNFISGFEMSLEVATGLRLGFTGPMYADLHSLLLDVDVDGTRRPRRLADWPAWAGCFDIVQVNEEEFERCGPKALESLEPGTAAPTLVAVTLGDRGVDLYGGVPSRGLLPQRLRTDGADLPTGRGHTANVTLDGLQRGSDPTGCGDVWGGVMFSRLLAGDPVTTAASKANRIAAESAGVSGVTALRSLLDGPT